MLRKEIIFVSPRGLTLRKQYLSPIWMCLIDLNMQTSVYKIAYYDVNVQGKTKICHVTVTHIRQKNLMVFIEHAMKTIETYEPVDILLKFITSLFARTQVAIMVSNTRHTEHTVFYVFIHTLHKKLSYLCTSHQLSQR